MRISTTPNATPRSTPSSSTDSQGGADASAGDELFIWRSLVPRLVHPVRLQIVEALIEKGGPMTIEELAGAVPSVAGNTDLARYHAKAMTEAGALEFVDCDRAQTEGETGKYSLFFPLSK